MMKKLGRAVLIVSVCVGVSVQAQPKPGHANGHAPGVSAPAHPPRHSGAVRERESQGLRDKAANRPEVRPQPYPYFPNNTVLPPLSK
jgi:hypothetical protein